MNQEPRAATRLEWVFIWAMLGGLALLVVAWHIRALGEREVNSPSVFSDLWLEDEIPPPQTHDFQPSANPGDRSIDGLRASALEQIKSVQLIGRDDLTSVWSRATCRTSDLLPITMVLRGTDRRLSIYDLVVVDVEVEDFQADTGRVRVIFRHATDPTLAIANEIGGTERWDYVGGTWVNRTCQYSEGPSLKQMILDGTIRRAD